MKFKNQGFALVLSLIVMAVAGALLTGLLFNTTTGLQISGNDLKSAAAESFSEMGLNKIQTAAYQSYQFYEDGHWKDYNLDEDESALVACGNYLSIGIDMDRIYDVTADGVNYRSTNSTGDIPPDGYNIFDFTLPNGLEGGAKTILDIEGDRAILTSEGFLGNSYNNAVALSKTLTSLRVETSANIWENAISASGETHTGSQKIDGRVAIFGSVHLLGDATTGTALNLSGNSGIYSTYEGPGTGTSTDITTEMGELTGPDFSSNLCAKVRIKSGTMSLGGSSVLGTASAPLAGIEIDTSYDPTHVHVVESKGYDSSNEITLPDLHEEYPNEPDSYFEGDIYRLELKDTDLPLPNSCNDFLVTSGSNQGFVIPPPVANPLNVGCTTLDDTNTFAVAGLAWLPDGTDCTLGNIETAIATTPTSGNGYLCVASNDGRDVIINLGTHDLYIGGNSNSSATNVKYEGRASIRVGDDDLDTSAKVVVMKGFSPPGNSTGNYFPMDHMFGIVSSGTVELAEHAASSSDPIAAVVFAMGEISITRQVVFIGALVTKGFFNASTNVPSIAYEPRILDNMLVGMPGREGIVEPFLLVEGYERR